MKKGTERKAEVGTEINLTATPGKGYHLKEWQVISGGVTIKDDKFTMPDSNVEVKAIFEKNTSDGSGGVTTYSITIRSSKNGNVSAIHRSAAKGAVVTLTVDPDKGYELDNLIVLDSKDQELKLTRKSGKYTFTMPPARSPSRPASRKRFLTSQTPFRSSSQRLLLRCHDVGSREGHHRRHWQPYVRLQPALHPRTDRDPPVAGGGGS